MQFLPGIMILQTKQRRIFCNSGYHCIDTDERLWVRRGTEEIPTFDVFDLEGNYLFKVELAGAGGSRGLFWGIKIDEFGILAYSLNPEEGYQKLYILEFE